MVAVYVHALDCVDEALHSVDVEVGVAEPLQVEQPDVFVDVWLHASENIVSDEHEVSLLLLE